MAPRPVRRAGLVLTGALLGLFVVAVVLWLWLRIGQVGELETALRARLELPAEALSVEEITPTGRIRIRLDDVALLGQAGDTVAAAPRLSMWFDATSLEDEGPIVFTDVVLQDPDLRLLRTPAGDWNVFQALALTAAGREVDTGGGEAAAGVLLRNVRIEGGELALALPAEPLDTASFAARLRIPMQRVAGVDYRFFRFRGIDARMPEIRFGGGAGWAVEVAGLDAALVEPEIRVAELRMRASSDDDAIDLAVAALRFGDSRLSADGRIRLADSGPLLDLQLRADPLRFSDAAAFLPGLPEEGTAAFAFDVESLSGDRIALAFSELDATAPGLQAGGRLGLVIGGGEAPVFRETGLEIASLDLALLEELGFADALPVRGTVRGTLSTVGEVETTGGTLNVDLAATLRPRDDADAAPSNVTAVGGLAFADEGGIVLREMRVGMDPLRLALLADAFPEQRERLRGVVRGDVTLAGPLDRLSLSGGVLAYEVGTAPPTRLAGLSGTVTMRPELAYDLRAEATPIALATLTELFPALPFRTATLSGPIAIAGDASSVSVEADLAGAAGAIGVSGDIALGEVPRFDVRGRVQTFSPGSVLRAQLPVEGALTGTFAVEGTAGDVAFDVDLAQTTGSFDLRGRFASREGEPPVFEAFGTVERFQIGALLGRAGLFPDPLSGRVDIRTLAAGQYRFDVDLRGEASVFDLEGYYNAGEVPTYAAAGTIAGLDLSRLPVPVPLPASDLDGRIDVEGRGTTLETLAGSFFFDAPGSTVGGTPLEAALVRATVAEGVLVLDTVAVTLADARIEAGGRLGLTRAIENRLDYRFRVPDLAALAAAVPPGQLPPELEGAVAAEGWVAGSVRAPELAFSLSGSGLRFKENRLGSVTASARFAYTPASGWDGEGTMEGDRIDVAGQSFEHARVQVNGTETRFALGLVLARAEGTDLALSGRVEVEGRVPRGIALESLGVRYDGAAWSLVDRATIRWGGVHGVLFEGLALRRTDGEDGLIRLDGQLPPAGVADLRVELRRVELEGLAQLALGAPTLAGTLDLDAVIDGPVDDPAFTLDAVVADLEYEGATADSVAVVSDYARGSMQASASLWTGGMAVADVESRIPMRLSFDNLLPAFEVVREGALTARATVDSLDLAMIAAVVPQLTEAAGRVSARATVSGTVERPNLQGWAALDEGMMAVEPLATRFEHVGARLFLEDNAIVIDSLAATNRGTARASGSVRFLSDGGPELNLRARLDDFEPIADPDVATLHLSGNLTLAGQLPSPELTGDVLVTDSEIRIPELSDPTGAEISDVEVGQLGADTVQAPPAGPGALSAIAVRNMEVTVGEGVWLVSDDARIQIGGDVVVTRAGENMLISGELAAERGTYRLQIGPLEREFEIARGLVRFFGTPELNPELDIEARNRIRTFTAGEATPVTVIVNITGSMEFPRIALTTDTRPPLPESEILSLLLFGRPTFELGGSTGAYAEELLAQEAIGGILFSPLERLFVGSGLVDYVTVRSAAGGGGIRNLGQTLGLTTVEVGTEITDNVFLTLECGVGVIFEATSARCGTALQTELGRDFTATVAYEPIYRTPLLQLMDPGSLEYQFRLELRRRWEYGIADEEDPVLPNTERVPRTGGGRDRR